MGKSRYVIDLRGSRTDALVGDNVRNVSVDDLESLAHLMLEAYRGTIDYEDEDLDDARTEVRSFFESQEPMLEHSHVALVDGIVVSAVLVAVFEGSPFISYVMTLPEHKEQGWARRVVSVAMDGLAGKGHGSVAFHITDGNIASEALFRSLGARRVESG